MSQEGPLELLERLLRTNQQSNWEFQLLATDAGRELMQRPPEQQREVVLAAVKRLRNKGTSKLGDDILAIVAERLLHRALPLTEADVCVMLEASRWLRGFDIDALVSRVLRAAERIAQKAPLGDDVRRELLATQAWAEPSADIDEGSRKIVRLVRKLVGNADDFPIVPGEAWAQVALADLAAADPDARKAWGALLQHCESATGSKPSAKWLKAAAPLVAAVGEEPFRQRTTAWFPLIDKKPPVELEVTSSYAPDPNLTICARNAELLKGLLWIAGTMTDSELARSIAALTASAYRKIPGIGARNVKLGNAGLYALGVMPTPAAVTALAVLKSRVKVGTAQKGIEKALDSVAAREGLSRDDVDELGVPGFGLEPGAFQRTQLGDHPCELSIVGNKVQLRWFKADGKPQKSVPKAVKDDHADALKALKADAKDIEKMLGAQRERIDGLFALKKEWPLAAFRERYLDHPLVSAVARRVIWTYEADGRSVSGIWFDNRVVDASGDAIEDFGDETVVRLWHPIEGGVDEALAWRRWLEAHEVQQPFKQAHREVYVLTDAERRTNTYSNRFASHILKQHQFNALCQARGWRNQLRLMVDDDYRAPSKALTPWGLRVEYWVEGVGDGGTDTTDAGTYLYLSTDQVRFYRAEAAVATAHAGGGGYETRAEDTEVNQPLALASIEPLAFSEVMRDVDLFVGVASVGNDPNWSDGGPEGRFVDYWQDYSFGELSETAQTRKAVLEGLIPRLKIRDRCAFEGRFLVVRGDLRTYKIHMGSGNILMAPNDEYLCIVQSGSAKASNVFLPFEGDARLSLILSKAFLLADDIKITDPTIVSQIGN